MAPPDMTVQQLCLVEAGKISSEGPREIMRWASHDENFSYLELKAKGSRKKKTDPQIKRLLHITKGRDIKVLEFLRNLNKVRPQH